MSDHNEAVSLMRAALALLDRDGHGVAACHLEQAINAVSAFESIPGEPPLRDNAQGVAESASTPLIVVEPLGPRDA